jgi:hypothetical protein
MTLRLYGAAGVVIIGLAIGPAFIAGLFAAGGIEVTAGTMAINGADGLCTLPEAIHAANANIASGPAAGECVAGEPGLDVIHLPAGTYTVSVANNVASGANGLPVISSPIEIVGDGAAATIIERDAAVATPDLRLFYVRSTGFAQYELTGSLVVRQTTLRNGKAEFGGAIYVQATNQVVNMLDGVVLAGNQADVAGAVWADSKLTMRDSRVENNFSRFGPGAIFVTSHLVVERTIFDGNSTDGSGGVASLGFNGTMDVSDSVFIRNRAKSSGGAMSLGGATLNVTRSWLHDNRAESSGGAIGTERLTMSYTTVSNNTSVTGGGGGVYVNGWAVVSHSTFMGNSAGTSGGGISGINLTMTNSTASGNRAVHEGGGVHAGGTNSFFSGNNLTVTNNQVTAENAVAGGLSFGSVFPAKIANSVIAGNVTGRNGRNPDCFTSLPSPGVTSLGHNLIGNTCGCTIAATTGDQFGTHFAPIAPGLGPLQFNGGTTATHMPLPASLAIDTASALLPGSVAGACELSDQRDVARPIDGDDDGSARGDRGAVERDGHVFPARPSFASAAHWLDEPGGTAVIRVERADPLGEVTVDYAAVAGSAVLGVDFLSAAGSLTFLEGESVKTFDVPILDDLTFDGPQSIQLTLRHPGAAADSVPFSAAMIFIADDESFPMTRPEDASSAEGDDGLRDVLVQVSLTQAYPFNVNVSYETIDGSAVAGSDYDAASGVLTIGGGTTSRSIALRIRGDVLDEPNETFTLKLATTIGCVSEIRFATVTIVDDDVTNRGPSIDTVDDQVNVEGDAPAVAVSADDPDGDTLTFTADGLPPGLAIDAATGVISGTIAADSAASYAVTVSVSDGDLSAAVSFTWEVTAPPPPPPPPPPSNNAPLCAAAEPSLPVLWPPNHKKTYEVGVLGVLDPDGDSVTLVVTGIRQDEPTNTLGDGTTWIDAGGVGTSTPWVRAERMGGADGRMYHIAFIASDPGGASCIGVVKVGVPHDQGKRGPTDGGPLYDSTIPSQPSTSNSGKDRP